MNKGKARRERKHQAELDARIHRGYAFARKKAERIVAQQLTVVTETELVPLDLQLVLERLRGRY